MISIEVLRGFSSWSLRAELRGQLSPPVLPIPTPSNFAGFHLDLVRSQGCCLKDHHDGKGLGVAGLGNWPPVHLYPSTVM